MEVDLERIESNVKNSLMLVTALRPKIGYDNSAEIAHKAHHEHTSLREAAVKLGFLTRRSLTKWVKPEKMTRPVRGDAASIARRALSIREEHCVVRGLMFQFELRWYFLKKSHVLMRILFDT